jgi:hypothetical protein
MSLTLASFAQSIRQALQARNNPAGREQAAQLLRDALGDTAFIAALFEGEASERKVLYQDPALGFCILAHQYSGAGDSRPHDHGPSWAIYGQAEGETVMTDWEIDNALAGKQASGAPARVKKLRSYLLSPGLTHVYNEGAIHSPSRAGPTRLVRIEGTDLARVKRGKYTPAAQ